ncbi:hypothetical protein V1478_018149 [Vespula squamosa]|uniref:Secreted protein n=1 Tax=Vespula squamosa TaxID=30214 RepID=A0ABD1ZWR4_VESSQ
MRYMNFFRKLTAPYLIFSFHRLLARARARTHTHTPDTNQNIITIIIEYKCYANKNLLNQLAVIDEYTRHGEMSIFCVTTSILVVKSSYHLLFKLIMKLLIS